MDVMQYINQIENEAGYSLDPDYFLTELINDVPATNTNLIAHTEPNNENTMATGTALTTLHAPIKKKRRRFSSDFKKNIVSMLETHTSSEIQERFNLDRRVISKWASNIRHNSNSTDIQTQALQNSNQVLPLNNITNIGGTMTNPAHQITTESRIYNQQLSTTKISGKKRGPKPYPRDPNTGAIIRPVDSEGIGLTKK
jgi:transposase-like protein